MFFLDFAAVVSSTSKTVDFLLSHKILSNSSTCTKCDLKMNMQGYENTQDRTCFRCPNCKCTRSIRTGSLVAGCKLPLPVIASIVYLLQAEVLHKTIAEILGLEEHVVGKYAKIIRGLYRECLSKENIKLGRQGRIVQVIAFSIYYLTLDWRICYIKSQTNPEWLSSPYTRAMGIWVIWCLEKAGVN